MFVRVVVDVCLCSTLPDGHCRVIDKPDTSESLLIDLGRKLEKAGADVLAPSDMGDHTVTNLKQETKKEVMAYVKWRSVFYSSFRDLAESSPTSGRSYQLPVDNGFGMVATANQYKSQKADYILLKPAQHSFKPQTDAAKQMRCWRTGEQQFKEDEDAYIIFFLIFA